MIDFLLMNEIIEFFKGVFDTSLWPKRWRCGVWSDFHGWLSIISDLFIGLAYVGIPLIILSYISKKNKNVPFQHIFLLFVAFILLCGMTHFMDVIIFWWPAYRLDSIIKLITAFVSMGTLAALYIILPDIFSLKTSAEFEKEIEQRRAVEEELRNEIELRKIAESELKLLQEERIEESEKKYNSIIQNAADGIITINDQGIMDMVNPAAAKLFGYTQEEMLGRNVKMLMSELNTKIIGIGLDLTGKKKDGTIFPLRLSVSEVRLKDRSIFTSILHDLTHQKMIEEKLRRYAGELEKSNKELHNFAYVSSQDLQEPLRKIEVYTNILQSEASKLSEDGKEYLGNIAVTTLRMKKLITGLLSFSRIGIRFEPVESLNLNFIANQVLEDLGQIIRETKSRIVVDDLPVIEADPVQIKQLFHYLIIHAIDSRKQDINLVLEIRSKKTQRKIPTNIPGDEVVELIFEDNGLEIDQAGIQDAFSIFPKLQGKLYQSSGMNLAVCRKIAVRHGGDIVVQSTPGKGNKFIVTLAVKQF